MPWISNISDILEGLILTSLPYPVGLCNKNPSVSKSSAIDLTYFRRLDGNPFCILSKDV